MDVPSQAEQRTLEPETSEVTVFTGRSKFGLLFARLAIGVLVLICAEVFSGASLQMGLWHPWTLIVTYWLYFLRISFSARPLPFVPAGPRCPRSTCGECFSGFTNLGSRRSSGTATAATGSSFWAASDPTDFLRSAWCSFFIR